MVVKLAILGDQDHCSSADTTYGKAAVEVGEIMGNQVLNLGRTRKFFFFFFSFLFFYSSCFQSNKINLVRTENQQFSLGPGLKTT